MRGVIRNATTGAAAVLIAAAGVASAAGTASAAGGPVISWAPTTSAGSYSYGQLTAGQTTSTTFTLTNSGGSASSALKITLTGSTAFSKTADTCTGTSLGPRKTCQVTVAYAPTTPGQNDTGTLTATGAKPGVSASLTLTGSAAAKATPVITTTQQPATGPVGTVIADQATVTGGFNPTGTVTFTLYVNPDCTGQIPLTDTEPLTNGMATGGGIPITGPGTVYWVATYNGDASNNPVASGCGDEPVTISPVQPVITTSPQPATATVGTAINDQVTLAGGFVPSGLVTFTLYDNASCAGPPLFANSVTINDSTPGTFTDNVSYTATAAGTDYWVVTYGGDLANLPASSGCADEPVVITSA